MAEVSYSRDRRGEDYVLRSRFGPVGQDLGRRTILINLDARRRAPVGENRSGDQWSSPRRGGRLRRSIRSEVVTEAGELVGRVIADAHYALVVHEGSRQHPISPHRPKQWLRWPASSGGSVWRRQVIHPGTKKGNPFLRRSLEAGRG